MIRRLAAIVSAGSLLLSVAIAIAWALTAWRATAVEFVAGGRLCRLALAAGRITVDDLPQCQLDESLRRRQGAAEHDSMLRTATFAFNLDSDSGLLDANEPDVRKRLHRLTPEQKAKIRGTEDALDDARQVEAGLQRLRRLVPKPPSVRSRSVSFRLILPLVAVPWACLSIVSAVRRRVRQSRADAEGCCRGCGYDLRASTDRCPECGTQIPSEAKA